MILPWSPVILVDVLGSFVTLIAALWCARAAWGWRGARASDVFRDYLFLLTLAFAFFAVSRSVGHLVKQFLLVGGFPDVWKQIAPYSGAVNTVSFVVVFAFGVYFERVRRVHRQLEEHRDHLERLVKRRTAQLERSNEALRTENEQRSQAEERLRETSATLTSTLQGANALAITGLDHEVLEANYAYREIWAGPSEDGPLLKCYDSRPGDHCHTPDCPLTLIACGAERVSCQVTKRDKHGKDRVFLQTTRPFKDGRGKLVGIVSAYQDMTEQKMAMDELAAERERLAVTLRSIGDGVITTDVAGRVVMMNPVAELLCGWSQEEARGLPLGEVFQIRDEATEEPLPCPADQVLSTRESVHPDGHALLMRRGKSGCAIAHNAAPIFRSDSGLFGVVLVFRDVSALRRMEQELLRRQKLESVGVLAGGIAHDFNNILTGVIGNIGLAQMRAEGVAAVGPLLAEAEKAAFRAKGLTEQLLTFAKGGDPVPQTLAIADVIHDSAVFVLRGSNVSCEMGLADDLQLVDIDPGQISQVVQNIILNARQVMPQGGVVTISGRNVRVGDADYVEITIVDRGPGIPAGNLDRIFDPYFSTREGGSGLGLAICHSIITRHRGTITVSSPPGGGAAFTICLPASRQKSGRPRESAPPTSARRSRLTRVLVMDDEVIVRSLLGNLLGRIGYQPTLVGDGAEAIEQYRAALERGERFDAVVMDLTVPGGMGGKEAVTHILALDPTAKVIVVSGYSTDPVMAHHADYGFSAAVAKPFKMEQIEAALSGVLPA